MQILYFCPGVFSSSSFSSPNLSRRRLDVYHTSTHDVALVQIYNAGLKCAACGSLEMHAQKSPKNRHLGTIAQICWAISSQLRHRSTYRQSEKNVKQQRLPHVSSQYGELRPTSGSDLLAILGDTCKFQRVSRLGSVTAQHSSSERQPNFAALNRGHHLYYTGRPSR